MGGAGALAAFAAKAMVASNAQVRLFVVRKHTIFQLSDLFCLPCHRNTRDLQMAADKAGDAFGETLDSAVTTKVCDMLPLLSTLQYCTKLLLFFSHLYEVVH